MLGRDSHKRLQALEATLQIIDGKLVAQQRKIQLKTQVEAFYARTHHRPCLAVILVGDDPASHVYVANKIKGCAEVGIASLEVRKPANLTQDELYGEIERLNNDDDVDGILVQLPLPKHINADEALAALSPAKDVDALTLESQGLIFAGRPKALPCTPGGIIHLLEHYKIPIAGANAVVVGRSHIVGKPMAQLLLQHDATVTICHSRTQDLRAHTKAADIVVVAAGRPEFLGRDDFKKESVIIDVGIHRQTSSSGAKKLVGDVRFSELDGWVRAATPVPGGVGPMTIATLLQNTLHLAELRKK